MANEREVEAERRHRHEMWTRVQGAGGPHGVPPSVLRDLGIYVGSQGIFFDKHRTEAVAAGGVTLSVLHTGRSYADDLTEGGVLYHYPSTKRAPSRDASEVAATKAAKTLRLPFRDHDIFNGSGPAGCASSVGERLGRRIAHLFGAFRGGASGDRFGSAATRRDTVRTIRSA